MDRRDPELIRALQPIARALNRRYFRLQVSGLENLCAGPALLAANHNGGITGPDLVCTMGTLWDALGPEAPLYALAHDLAMRVLAPCARALRKLGCLRASPENARRALALGGKVLVYPGGDLDAYRPFRERNRVILGNRSGFARVAQRASVPIIPIVAYGAHRSAYIIDDGAFIARALKLPERGRVSRFPIAFALPYGLALGPYLPYFPLPFPIRLRILPALRVGEGEPPEHARERVRSAMQSALDEMAEAERCFVR